MSALSRGAGEPRRPFSGDLRAYAVVLPLGALLAVAMTYVLYRFPPAPLVVLAGTLGLSAIVALAIAHYEAAAALGFLLLGVVRVEPAPPDAILAVVMAVGVVTGRVHLNRVPLIALGLLAVFIALNLISTVEAIDPAAAARFILITVYLAAFGVWLTSFVSSTRRARTLVRAYLAGALLFAIVSSLALFLPVPLRNELLAYDGTRAAGLFEDPNVYGPFLIPAALIVVEELLSPRLLKARSPTKVLMFSILSLGVVLSYSRAAWISLAASVLVLLVVVAQRRGGGRRATTALAVVVATTVAAGGVLAITGSLGFLQERAHLQSYDSQRFGAQREGLALAAQYPFGVGPGQFDVLAPVSTHSTYVRALSEQGLLGFFAILTLLLATLVLAGRNAVLGRDTYGIGSATLFAAWFGLLINSFVVDTLHWRHLFLVAGLVWAGSRRPLEEGDYARASGSRTAVRGLVR